MKEIPLLTRLRRKDFTKNDSTKKYRFRKMQIMVTYDRLNERWVYTSLTHPVSGIFYGSVYQLTRKIINEYFLR